MKWNLRMVAAQRDIWKASELQRLLAEAGLAISAGKMSHLWSGRPLTVRLDDLDIICDVLNCTPADLLIPEKSTGRRETTTAETEKQVVGGTPITHQRRQGRSGPPL
ncbi:helix-turn-helix transcriptional regulator (plasmid) [Streptomyces sp. NBC_01591]|uniref:helix-turn-helix domain-containing protein n=1 Tax=Streptomyces sp. NBC_01591 TaxID=2975888 RepID=UPI002DDA711B|nr:helix-turn-helix transcriptional regulator [Streptomyces sp. NBC_01591]WSD74321.1 helix-turn-helix transcriptional regulator [Streptomyces sp. NBC_01591]